MKTKIFVTVLFLCISVLQSLHAQIKYAGSLNMNKKCKSFLLTSEQDTFNVLIGKKSLDFYNRNNFSFSKTKKRTYKLTDKYDTIIIVERKKQIGYLTDILFSFDKKKSKKLVLKDQTGKIVVDANYILKRGIADFHVTISDSLYKTSLLAYSTFYLYNQSKILKAAYDTPFIYYGY